ncbi:hypothetical protein METSCH_A06000 [Metschnikowia aff. pulcherrima]|uniref:Uncharacterized protein n=1 Tax=Metschnikowia aff. pulcherrima TaxID=2163413 RepID=A0A4P6XH71_9ASCO|nr:hypothetical protein METSCH_A06000 [Metschnikowia aff. pulcherrima]
MLGHSHTNSICAADIEIPNSKVSGDDFRDPDTKALRVVHKTDQVTNTKMLSFSVEKGEKIFKDSLCPSHIGQRQAGAIDYNTGSRLRNAEANLALDLTNIHATQILVNSLHSTTVFTGLSKTLQVSGIQYRPETWKSADLAGKTSLDGLFSACLAQASACPRLPETSRKRGHFAAKWKLFLARVKIRDHHKNLSHLIRAKTNIGLNQIRDHHHNALHAEHYMPLDAETPDVSPEPIDDWLEDDPSVTTAVAGQREKARRLWTHALNRLKRVFFYDQGFRR